MNIVIGTDHGGFALKKAISDELVKAGHKLIDLGVYDESPADYPDPARRVGEAVAEGKADRGILLCGSGVGVSIAANKIKGVRAAVCHDVYLAAQGVEHDAMNVLCLGARVIGPAIASVVTQAFLNAEFNGEERHQRRLDKVIAMESDLGGSTTESE